MTSGLSLIHICIPTNAEVVFLGKAPTIKVSEQLAGRFFNAFGDPIDCLLYTSAAWLGQVDENFQPLKIMVPFEQKGVCTVKSIAKEGDYSIEDTICLLYTSCIMNLRVTFSGEVKDFRSAAEAKASLNRAYSRKE